jgi:hypothetical protein
MRRPKLLLALPAAALAYGAAAKPIDVPIIINGPLPPPGTVACSGNHTSPGDVIATMTLVQPAPNVIFALSGQDAARFILNGSAIEVGATALDLGVTYSLTVETIPSVDFDLVCAN